MTRVIWVFLFLGLVGADKPPKRSPFVGPIRPSAEMFIPTPDYHPKVGHLAYALVYDRVQDIAFGGRFMFDKPTFMEFHLLVRSGNEKPALAMQGKTVFFLDPATPVLVEEIDETTDPPSARVKVIGSKTLDSVWVRRDNITYRKRNPDYRPHLFEPPATNTVEQLAAPIAAPMLILTDVVTVPLSESILSTQGRLKNVSAQPIRSAMVTITYEDARGKLVATSAAFITPTSIEPGAFATFSSFDTKNPAADHVKLEFSGLGESLTWTDRSGKNAKKR